MADDDEFPRLHGVGIDPATLEGEGEPFAEVVARHGAEPIPVTDPEGWRMLMLRGDQVVIGAPVDAERRMWRLAYVDPGDGVQLVDEAQRLQVSRAERRRGLTLRWPAALPRDAGPGGFAIDIVNTGDERWMPDGDSFQVVGALTAPGETSFSVGWAYTGGARAVPLDPGDYARVPVDVSASAWEEIEAGEHDLHALLVPLTVRSEPLRIEVSPVTVTSARRARSRPDTGRRVRALQDEIRRQRAILDAGPRLADVVAVAGAAPTEDDAVAAIGALLGVDVFAARAVFQASLRELHPSSREMLQERIAHTERSLERQSSGDVRREGEA